MNDGGVGEEDDGRRQVGGGLLWSFFPAAPPLPPTQVEELVARVAVAWQRLSAYATLVEIAGANAAQPHGRMAEIFARLASSGEQLMLAGTCLRDARRWDSPTSSELARNVATRGLAEMANYFALSAAHGLANTTLRLLLLEPASRDALNRRYPRADGFPPFTDKEQAWIAMNPGAAAAIAEACAGLPPVVREMVGLLTRLARDERWVVLMKRRAVDFHQLRPQSVEGGAPVTNPWRSELAGVAHLEIGEFNGHQPPIAAQLVAESNQAVEALASLMGQWLDLFPQVLRTLLGTPVPE